MRTKVFTETSLAPLAAASCVIAAHGHQDDHLRITVLLAHALGAPSERDVHTCTDPRSSWQNRREALESLLRTNRRHQNPIALIDPDALDMGEVGAEAWDDAYCRRERKELFQLLLHSFGEDYWLLLRPEPKVTTTLALLDNGCASITSTPPQIGSRDDERLIRAMNEKELSPALQSLVRGMVAAGKISGIRTAARLVEASDQEHVESVLLETAYDSLSLEALEAAKCLSLIRGRHPLNGMAGPFEIGNANIRANNYSLSREALNELVSIGMFGFDDDQHQFLMSKRLRDFFARRAGLSEPIVTREIHHWLGTRSGGTLDDELESHHHAISSGDVELAVSTARYYGSDLRRLARELSEQDRFHEAASIYQIIVDRFDKTDSYAWEYLAYNLARHYSKLQAYPPPADEKRIRAAYEEACSLNKQNPLFRGREIGFRARMGEDVHTAFEYWMAHFSPAGRDGLVYLAKPVLEALAREERNHFARKWLREIRNDEKIRSLLNND